LQVCVPAFTNNATPVELKVKNIVDNDYCYNQVSIYKTVFFVTIGWTNLTLRA
jgi:hypothetical protein